MEPRDGKHQQTRVNTGSVTTAGHASERPAGDSASEGIWHRYAEYLASSPETVVQWKDPETTARGWLVINSLRGGAAGGGTRMRMGLTSDEVVFLAKVMELKFSISGPPMGGAKSGIDFDPDDPRKRAVLRRWFRAIRPYLESCYSTAGDLNVDEVREVVPICSEIGLHHPQQGLARGHLGLREEDLARRLAAVRDGLGQLVEGELGVPGLPLPVADLVTGFSVAIAARRLLERQGRSLEGVRVLLEGFGRVGGAAALYLSGWGSRLVGIVDDRNALVCEEGLDESAVADLLRRRMGNRLPEGQGDEAGKGSADARERFGTVPADLFVCAAASGTVTPAVLDRLEVQGVESIICGANHPFDAAFPGDTSLERDADARFAVVADFIANCGTAHAFAVQIQRDDPVVPDEIFDSIEMTVCAALDEAVARAGNPRRGLLAAAIDAALERCATAS
jgi:glutamate dehydrogenase (NAD(P)+)